MDGARTLPEVIRDRARLAPGAPAFTYLPDGERVAATLSFGELDAEVRALAATLLERAQPGDRALLLYPHGLDFVRAFLACLYTGIVAVPAYPPRLGDRHGAAPAQRVASDCDASLLLTTAEAAERVRAWGALQTLATDMPALAAVSDWEPRPVRPDHLAFLQYTSGSTAAPKGVMVTHGNLLHSERMIASAFGHTSASTFVDWLPLYHDMGLVGSLLQPLYVGAHSVLMPPEAFLQQPARWLRAISHFGGRTGGGPNFAYELCVRRVRPEQLEGVDLSGWEIAFNGAEPVRASTLETFSAVFAPWGFRREAFYPCYGLAEVTLFASGGRKLERPSRLEVDAERLKAGRAVPTECGVRLVSSGRAWLDRRIEIVDPVDGTRCAEGIVGEIWLMGADVARGYWNRHDETAQSFGARLDDGDGPFLRTGDLGFMRGEELVVTGRLKDLIVVAGRNVYPQDIEDTVEQSSPLIRSGCSAVFSYERGGTEHVAVVAELRATEPDDPATVIRRIREQVGLRHGLSLSDVALIEAGTLDKTSSGKVRRSACRRRLLDGKLQLVSASSLPVPAEAEGAV
ncbi:fatty acyl-AMP ligase [Solirubrobacter taibaiensis]|nr:fatty acyl-AMP ligase [Solirubrobacter taibaiensis]